ncbi:MAG: hypothetical protein ACTHMG_06645 [Sphingomonas sp.]
MAEDDRKDPHEGWEVPFRIGALGGLAVPAVLLAGVLIGGTVYDYTLRPKLNYTVTPQPAPGLKADVHAGVSDPEVAPPVVRPDPVVERAKAAAAAQGLPDWPVGNGQ